MRYTYLIENQRNITHTVSLLSCGSWVRIPTGSHEKQNAPDSGQAFFVPDLTGPGLAQGLEVSVRKRQAQPGTFCDAHVR